MSERDTKANMTIVRGAVEDAINDAFPKEGRERNKAQLLAECGLTLLEAFLLDINRIADAQTAIARVSLERAQEPRR